MSLAVLDPIDDCVDEALTQPEVPEGCELVDGEVHKVHVSTESSRLSGKIDFRLERYCE